MDTEKWTVHATDRDTLQHVGFIDSGVIGDDEYDAGDIVELSDGGYVAEFHAYRRGAAPGSVGYDITVTVYLSEPAITYADVFRTHWDACDAE